MVQDWDGVAADSSSGSFHTWPQRLHMESLVVVRCRMFLRPHFGHFGISNGSSVMKKIYLFVYMFALAVFIDCACSGYFILPGDSTIL
jgi:hypothetical protein